MEIKFSTDLQTILCYARDEAMRTGSYGINADHVVLGMLRHRDNDACRMLAACGIDPDALKAAIDEHLFNEEAIPWPDQDRIRPTRTAAALLGGAAYEALKQGLHEISASHLLLALSRHEKSKAAEILRSRQLDYDHLLPLMREKRYALPEQDTALPRMEDLLGPLGDQLTRLYTESKEKTNIYS